METATAVKAQSNTPNIPAIGSEWNGGIYAGLTIHENKPAHLILLPGQVIKTWSDAKVWAAEQNAELPSRVDALILFQNLKGEFEERWYWTGELDASDPASAWLQDFLNGYQHCSYTYHEFRARAVRRLPI